MKIAIVCRRYYPDIGGIETHVKEIAERFARKHEVIVFTLVNDKKQTGDEIINGVKVKRFKHLGLTYSAEIPPNSLLRQVEEFNPDIVHSHSAHTSIPYFASRVKSKSKFVITPHYQGNATTAFRRILFIAYKRFLVSAISKADRIICVSSAEREMLSKVFPLNQQKVRIVPNGVGSDLTGIIRDSGQRQHLRILSVGRFDLSHKKIDKLIKAFKILSSMIDSKLILVGNGPDKQEIVRIIKDLDLNERVELKSNLTREELVREYARASIFVTASEQEAFGIAVAEALAAKLKVVVPNSTALSTYVKAGYALGVEVPVTPESIAQAIISCIENSFQTVQYAPYTWDMVARDLETVYEEMCRENN
jgi:glycosyltransferase involved in cell wall biosynthesis